MAGVGAGRAREKERWGTPASQSLRESSHAPETIVEPSGEKATESMRSSCALCFLAFTSQVTAHHT